MPQPPEVVAASDDYLAQLERSLARIRAQQKAIVDGTREARKVARLAEFERALRAELDRVLQLTETWLTETIPIVYAQGAVDTGLVAALTWTQINTAAAQAIIDFHYGTILEATDFMSNDAKRWFRDVARINNERAALEGLTRVQQGRVMRQIAPRAVNAAGAPIDLRAVIYKNGTRHGLAEYSNMLARTTTAMTYNTGSTDQMAASGVNWVEVFDGVDCGATSHDDPDKVNGTIRPLRFARANPIAHPNCRRSFGARPDLRTPADAETASPSATPETAANQARHEQQTIIEHARRRTRASRTGRSSRTGRTARSG